ARYRNTVVVVVFEDVGITLLINKSNRIGQAGGSARGEKSGWSPDGTLRAEGRSCRAGSTVRAVEQEVAFLDRPAVVFTDLNAVNLFDVILANVGFDQVTRDEVEAIAIGIAEPIRVDLRHLARALERVARWDSVLAVSADRIRAGGIQCR